MEILINTVSRLNLIWDVCPEKTFISTYCDTIKKANDTIKELENLNITAHQMKTDKKIIVIYNINK